TASITAPMSSRCSSRYGGSGPRSDRPTPRMSNSTSREKEASRSRKRAQGGCSHMISTFDQMPVAGRRSTGPSPTTWYAMWTSPLFAYAVSGTSVMSLDFSLRRAASIEQLQGCRSRHDLRKLVLEIDAGHARDLGSRHHIPVRRRDVERVGRVEDEPHVVPEV